MNSYFYFNNQELMNIDDNIKSLMATTSEPFIDSTYRKKYNKFYSTNEELISFIDISDELISLDESLTIVEPFAGDCDLLKLFEQQLIDSEELISSINLYDITNINNENIDNLTVNIFNNHDSLLNNIFSNDEKSPYFVITNPPYTAKNKLTQEMKSKYSSLLVDVQDLYQIFIKQLIDSYMNIDGGILVLPSNFMFGKQSMKLRNQFLTKFDILVLNIFEKQMFDYTTQSTITIQFINKLLNETNVQPIVHLFKKDEVIDILSQQFQNILSNSLILNNVDIKRYRYFTTRNYNIDEERFIVSNIKVSLLDPNMKAYIEPYDNIEDKNTDRAFMRLCFNHQFTNEQEMKIVELFNDYLAKVRESTYSLIFTSYREYSRKRLSFEEVYEIMNYIINSLIDD